MESPLRQGFDELDSLNGSVAIDGDRILLAEWGIAGEVRPGQLHALVRTGTSWSLSGTFESEAAVEDDYGHDVGLFGQRGIVGAPGAANGAGAVSFVQLAARGTRSVLTSPLPTPGVDRALASDGETLFASSTADVHAFQRSGASWQETQVLPPPAGYAFGGLFSGQGSLVLDGDTLLADTRTATTPASIGPVAVFRNGGTSWVEEGSIDASVPMRAIDLSDDTALVHVSGEIHVYVRSGSTWHVQTVFNADTYADGAIEGDCIALGATGGYAHAGRVYVYERSGTQWAQTAQLEGDPDAIVWHNFGNSVELESDRLLVGAPGGEFYDLGHGQVHVFARDGSSWIEEARLGEQVSMRRDYSAWSFAADGDRVAIPSPVFRSGSVQVYERSADGWRLTHDVRDESYLLFGFDVALAGSWLFATSEESTVHGPGIGAAFAYDLSEGFASLCDGSDGSLALCPCGNQGLPDTGCDISQATGGVSLTIAARERAPLNRATAVSSGYPTGTNPAATLLRSPSTISGGPVVFGDGVLCLATPLVRLGGALAVGGNATHVFGHGPMAGGGTFTYQLHLRNAPAMFCDPSAAFNLSDGRQIVW
jgi:hypothetical protein